MPGVQGINHVSLAVSDVAASASWYEKVFAARRLFEDKNDQYQMAIMMIAGVIVGLQRKAADAGDRFSEFRTGLDHAGFGVATRAEVDAWKEHLDTLGVQNSGVIQDAFGNHLNFRDPDNIALEIFAPPS